jgi:single-strand DNA-binding protein
MMQLNKVLIIGRLCADPELRYAGSTEITECRLASNYSYRRKDGEEVEEVCFLDVTLFGKAGESIRKHAQKGSGIMFEGRLRFEQWDDRKTGEKRSKHKLTADRWTFAESKADAEARTSGGQTPSGGSAQREEDDPDLPF